MSIGGEPIPIKQSGSALTYADALRNSEIALNWFINEGGIRDLRRVMNDKLKKIPSSASESDIDAEVSRRKAVHDADYATRLGQFEARRRSLISDRLKSDKKKAEQFALFNRLLGKYSPDNKIEAKLIEKGWLECKKRSGGDLKRFATKLGVIEIFVTQRAEGFEEFKWEEVNEHVLREFEREFEAGNNAIDVLVSEDEVDQALSGDSNLNGMPEPQSLDTSRIRETVRTELNGVREQARVEYGRYAKGERGESVPPLLWAWMSARREGQNPITPKMIRFFRPRSSLGTSRGPSATITTDQDTGDIIAFFPPDKKHVFTNVRFVDFTPDLKKGYGSAAEETYEITEWIEGREEVYHVVAGRKDTEGNPILVMKCPATEVETPLKFGDAKVVSDFFMGTVRKPVIAFRNFTEDTTFTATVDFSGKFSSVYPLPQHRKLIKESESLTWKGVVHRNNAIAIGSRQFPYLFWDGTVERLDRKVTIDECSYVTRSEVIQFLEDACDMFGMDASLKTDFVTFWAPYLETHEHILVKFLTPSECEQIARLRVDIPGLRVIRMYMAFQPIQQPSALKKQHIPKVILDANRKTLFEWGGFEVPKGDISMPPIFSFSKLNVPTKMRY